MEINEKEVETNEKEVECISCGEIVAVKLVEYGLGHIAVCPKCGKLAYNK